MTKSALSGYGMASKRVMLSDKHFHNIQLSEESMGVICHALDTLAIAFSLEPDYYERIRIAAGKIKEGFNAPAITQPPAIINSPR